MGRKESDRVSEREEFCLLCEGESLSLSMAELCRRFGVSRKTGYKWLERWKKEGKLGLEDRSRRPDHSPKKSSDTIESEVVKLRRAKPKWGGGKLKQILENRGVEGVPSPSSITRILHRHGLVEPGDSARHQPWKRFEMDAPNDNWQVDFKGDFGMSPP